MVTVNIHSLIGEMAYHGHRVKIYDNNLNALDSAYYRIEEDKKLLRDEGLLLHKNFIVSRPTGLSSDSYEFFWRKTSTSDWQVAKNVAVLQPLLCTQ